MFGKIDKDFKLAKEQITSLPKLQKQLETDLVQTTQTNEKMLVKLQ